VVFVRAKNMLLPSITYSQRDGFVFSNLDIPDPVKISNYLTQVPSLAAVLNTAVNKLVQAIPDAKISLTHYQPDKNTRGDIVITVFTALEAEEACAIFIA
jgi:hypothetical protein